jgi:alanine-glyoxylate transaminase / serine-glyoxylate transaminase / serine-pyruvate transaminase
LAGATRRRPLPEATMNPNPRIPGQRFLHSPGPTRLPDEVLHAMGRQPMDLADPRLDPIIAACEAGLKRLLHTEHADVLMYAANGHGAWEAVIVNLLGPGRAALIPGTGHFSESWAIQAEALGCKVVRTPWAEGMPIDVAAVEQALRDDTRREIVAVFAVHTDTASGVTSDLRSLRAALDASDHPALFVVDVVASLGVVPFDMDALRADVVIGASQKGLMLPPGLGFVAINERARASAAANPMPRFYWDWGRRRDSLSYRKFCGTPPMNLLFGLQAALELLFAEGLDAVFARHALLAGAVHAAVHGWSEGGALSFFCQQPARRSHSVTAVAVRPGVDPEALRSVARERFQVALSGGLGPLAGRVFRIGHMGDINAAMVLGALAGVEAALRAQGIPIGSGGVQCAVDALARA